MALNNYLLYQSRYFSLTAYFPHSIVFVLSFIENIVFNQKSKEPQIRICKLHLSMSYIFIHWVASPYNSLFK